MKGIVSFCRRAVKYAWKMICSQCKYLLYHGQIQAGKRSIMYKTQVRGGGKLSCMTRPDWNVAVSISKEMIMS